MTDLRKAAELALEALEDVFGLEKKDVAAIQALRQALAQPEEEFVYEAKVGEVGIWGEK